MNELATNNVDFKKLIEDKMNYYKYEGEFPSNYKYASNFTLFQDTKTAYRHKCNSELKRSLLIFQLIQYPFILKIGLWLIGLFSKVEFINNLFTKHALFKHFIGGETFDECSKTVSTLSTYNVQSMLDLAIENEKDDQLYEFNFQRIILLLRNGKGNKKIPFIAVKITGFADAKLLEKMQSSASLTQVEMNKIKMIKERLYKIVITARDSDMMVYIDAEESWVQDTMDTLVNDLMIEFNKEKVVIGITIQMYRKEGMDILKTVYADAVKHEYFLGIKLVRGAYLEQEHSRAKNKSYDSPVFKSKNETDNSFNNAVQFCVDHIDKISLCLATHNELSCYLLICLMNERKIPKNHAKIYFSQLYGMSDHISFNLAREGYNVVKYIPFGPVQKVIPYLIRRSQENSSISEQTARDLKYLKKEKLRRGI